MNINDTVFCFQSLIPVRSEHKDQAEIVTQLLFGEPATIIDSYNQWRKIRIAHDDYEGWIDRKQVAIIDKATFEKLKNSSSRQGSLLQKIDTPWGKILTLMGSLMPSGVKSFEIGEYKFEITENNEEKIPLNLEDIALNYLNAPYLWGGRTHFGIDCSGFTQAVYRFFEINLPRDASQQVYIGNEINFEDTKVGDIAFFQNTRGKVNHVGIILAKNEFIHASGRVRIDKLTEEGIYNNETDKLTHKIYNIKRIFHLKE